MINKHARDMVKLGNHWFARDAIDGWTDHGQSTYLYLTNGGWAVVAISADEVDKIMGVTE